jgi:hypothetical protein
LIPFLTPRLNETVEALGDADGLAVPMFMSRLWAKDQSVLLVAAVTPEGSVKGHCAALVHIPGQVLVVPPKLDEPTENDAISEMLGMVEEWAKGQGATILQLVSKRADPKWLKKHGYETARYVMTKQL